MSRPGVNEPTDDGVFVAGQPGHNANIRQSSPVLFVDGAIDDAEDMGSGLTQTQIVCQDDGKCLWAPNPDSATAGDLSTFNGEASNGTWQLCVGDSGLLDPGDLETVTLNICK